MNEAIRIDSNRFTAFEQRGWAKADAGNYDGAQLDFDEALRINPEWATAYVARSINNMVRDQPDLALIDADKAIELAGSKETAPWRNRCLIRRSLGDYKGAIEDARQAAQVNSADPAVLIDLARLLATSRDEKLRDGSAAVELATKACELRGFKRFLDLDVLAAAHAEKGEFETAVEWQTKAVELRSEVRAEGQDVSVTSNLSQGSCICTALGTLLFNYQTCARRADRQVQPQQGRGEPRLRLLSPGIRRLRHRRITNMHRGIGRSSALDHEMPI